MWEELMQEQSHFRLCRLRLQISREMQNSCPCHVKGKCLFQTAFTPPETEDWKSMSVPSVRCCALPREHPAAFRKFGSAFLSALPKPCVPVKQQTHLIHSWRNRGTTELNLQSCFFLQKLSADSLKIYWAVRTKQGIQETLLIPSSISLTSRVPQWLRVNEGLELVNEIGYTTLWMRQIVHLWRKGIIFCCA